MYSFHLVNTIFHMHSLLLILFLVNLSKIPFWSSPLSFMLSAFALDT